MDIYNIIGFIGTFLYILSYFLLQSGKLNQGVVYIFLNLLAALFVAFSLLVHWNAPSFIIQSVWVVISLYGLFRLYFLKKNSYKIHIVFDELTKEIPTFIILLDSNLKIISFYDYSNKKFWKEFSLDKVIQIEKERYYYRKIQVPSYTSPPPLRHQVSHYEDKALILSSQGEVLGKQSLPILQI